MWWDEIGRVAVLLIGIGLCGTGVGMIYVAVLCSVEFVRRWIERRQRRRERRVERQAYQQGYNDGNWKRGNKVDKFYPRLDKKGRQG